MKNLRALTLAALCISACTDGQPTTAAVEEVLPLLRIGNQGFVIEGGEAVKVSELPRSTELKMLDGDLAKFAAHLCEIESGPEIVRCDLFVQPDHEGSVRGYMALATSASGSVSVYTELDGNCWISGNLERFGDTDWESLTTVNEDFEASLMFRARQRSPGDWLVGQNSRVPSENSPNLDESDDYAFGVWYFERVGDKLRVSQERWSYCSEDVVIDEVFQHLLLLQSDVPK